MPADIEARLRRTFEERDRRVPVATPDWVGLRRRAIRRRRTRPVVVLGAVAAAVALALVPLSIGGDVSRLTGEGPPRLIELAQGVEQGQRWRLVAAWEDGAWCMSAFLGQPGEGEYGGGGLCLRPNGALGAFTQWFGMDRSLHGCGSPMASRPQVRSGTADRPCSTLPAPSWVYFGGAARADVVRVRIDRWKAEPVWLDTYRHAEIDAAFYFVSLPTFPAIKAIVAFDADGRQLGAISCREQAGPLELVPSTGCVA